jgi:hypothetical protein
VQVVVTNSVVVPLASRGRNGSTFAKALATAQHETTEHEPNDKPANATQVSLSDGINGRFDKPADHDCYEFAARKGERIEFRAATRSLGSPCDVVLELQSTGGAQLRARTRRRRTRVFSRTNLVSNGTYRLVAEESRGAFGPNWFIASPPTRGRVR